MPTTLATLTSPATADLATPVAQAPASRLETAPRASFREALAERTSRPQWRESGEIPANEPTGQVAQPAGEPCAEADDAPAQPPANEHATSSEPQHAGEQPSSEQQAAQEPIRQSGGGRIMIGTQQVDAQPAQQAPAAAQPLPDAAVSPESEAGNRQGEASQSQTPAPKTVVPHAANPKPVVLHAATETSVAQPMREEPARAELPTASGASERPTPPADSPLRPVPPSQSGAPAVETEPPVKPSQPGPAPHQPRQAEPPPTARFTAERVQSELLQAVAPNSEPTGSDARGSESGEMPRGEVERPRAAPTPVPAAARAVQVETAVQLQNLAAQLSAGEHDARDVAPQVRAANAVSLTAGSLKPDTAEQWFMPQGRGVDDGEFSHRIIRGLSAMINQRGGVMNMRLHPPELGQLRVQMSIIQGTVNAQFTVMSEHAQTVLDRNLMVLRSALQSHGLTVEKLGVQLATAEQPGGALRQEAGEQEYQQQGAHHDHDAADRESRGKRHGERPPQSSVPGASPDFAADLGVFAQSLLARAGVTGGDQS